MARTWYDCAAAPGGPPVRVYLPAGRCRTWWPVVQSATTVNAVALPTGVDVGAPGTVAQSFGPAALATAQTSGLPLADDRVALDVQIQGPPGSRVALVIDDGCC